MKAPETPRKPKLTMTSLSRDFRELVWPRRGILSLGLGLILINRLAGLVLPGATKFLIDEVVQKRNTALLFPIVCAAGGAVLLQGITSFSLMDAFLRSTWGRGGPHSG